VILKVSRKLGLPEFSAFQRDSATPDTSRKKSISHPNFSKNSAEWSNSNNNHNDDDDDDDEMCICRCSVRTVPAD